MSELDGTEDPERLVRLVAHLIARVGDRFTFLRKFSRHLEGTEKKAGVFSDIFAASVEFYKRNPESVEKIFKAYGKEIMKATQERKAQEKASKNGAVPQHQEAVHATP